MVIQKGVPAKTGVPFLDGRAGSNPTLKGITAGSVEQFLRDVPAIVGELLQNGLV